MDPASILVILLAAWAITQRTPGIIGQAAAEWQAGRRVESSEAAEQLRKRLAGAGVEPSTGHGPLRNFLGNLWRDYWHDKDQDRQRQANDGQVGRERSWWRRQVDDAADRQAAKYRGGTPTRDAVDPEPTPAGDQTGDGEPRLRPDTHDGEQPPSEVPNEQPGSEEATEPRPPIKVPSTVGPEPSDQEPGGDAPRPIPGSPHGLNGPGRGGSPTGAPPGPGPLRVPSTISAPQQSPASAVAVLDPPVQQPRLEGTNPMGTAVATNGVAITTMTSGAYEMGSIDARLHAAVNNFVADLTQLQNRLVRAGESTLSTVQLSSRSTVMGSMSQAVEAISALKAAARGCAGEVSPLVQATRREFEKRI